MPEVLHCRDLHRSFGGVPAVDGVGFTIDRGETYGLLGPNGAGKTTTISMITGLLRPDRGSVTVAGLEMSPAARDAKARIGLVPQDLAIYPELTAQENLAFFAKLYGLGRRELGTRVAEVLDTIGLADRADDRVSSYSGGMKRRLNIGLGLLHRPDLLVLDEPTVGVDPQSRNSILSAVEELGTSGLAVLYTTHYMEEAERLCDRIGVMERGRLIVEGTRRELVAAVGEQDVVRIGVDGTVDQAVAALRSLPAVRSVELDERELVCLVEEAATQLPRLLETITATGVAINGVQVREPDLEDVFLHLTGRGLRD